MKGKKIIFSLISLLVVALLLGGGAYYFKGRKKDIKYKTAEVDRGDIKSQVSATGTLNPVTTVIVGSQITGRIIALYADFNSRVKRGELIAKIDPAIFEAQVSRSEANLKNAQANLEKAKVDLANKERHFKRSKELYAQNLIALSDLDNDQTAYESALADIKSQQAQISQAQANLKLDKTNLQYTDIYSPVAGTVISRNVDVGQTVSASLSAPTLFTIAQDLTRMQVDTNVDEADVGQVQIGQKADFTVDAYQDRKFVGKVSMIKSNPTIVQNVVSYDTIVEVSNTELLLKPGMTANVSLIVSQSNDVLRIPNAAFRFRPPEAQVLSTGSDRGGKGQRREGVNRKEESSASKNDNPGEARPERFAKNPDSQDSGGRGRGGRSQGQREYWQKRRQQSQEGSEKIADREKPKNGGKGLPPLTVWVLRGNDNKIVPIKIIPGISDGRFTEVLGGGVKEGDKVVTGIISESPQAPFTGGNSQSQSPRTPFRRGF